MEDLDIYKFKKLIKDEVVADYLHRNDTDVWNSTSHVSNVYPIFQYSISDYSPILKLTTYHVKCEIGDAFKNNDEKYGISRFFGLIQSTPIIFRNVRIGTYIRIIVNINGYRTNYPILYDKCVLPQLIFNYSDLETNDCLIDEEL